MTKHSWLVRPREAHGLLGFWAAVILAVALLCVLHAAAFAVTFTVPSSTYPTIKAAVDSVPDTLTQPITISVSTGTYTEAVLIENKIGSGLYPLKLIANGDVTIEGGENPTSLHQNQPNPFAAATTFRFDLPRPTIVQFELFDITGRRVVVLRNGWLPAGRHSLDWDGRDGSGAAARPGAYLCRMTAGSFRAEKKLVVLP